MKIITSSFVVLVSSTVALAQHNTTTVQCKKYGASLALFLGLPFQPYIWSEEKCLNTCGANGETCSWSQGNGICECPIVANGGVSSSSSRISSTTSTTVAPVSTAISTAFYTVPTSIASLSSASQQPSIVSNVVSTPTVLAVVNVTASTAPTAPKEMEPVDMYDAVGFELKCADPKRTPLTAAENKPNILLNMDKKNCLTKCSDTGDSCKWESKQNGCICRERRCNNKEQIPVPYGQESPLYAVNADKCKTFCRDDSQPCEYDWETKRCICERPVPDREPEYPYAPDGGFGCPLLFDL